MVDELVTAVRFISNVNWSPWKIMADLGSSRINRAVFLLIEIVPSATFIIVVYEEDATVTTVLAFADAVDFSFGLFTVL